MSMGVCATFMFLWRARIKNTRCGLRGGSTSHDLNNFCSFAPSLSAPNGGGTRDSPNPSSRVLIAKKLYRLLCQSHKLVLW